MPYALIVDDNRQMAESLEQMLGLLGCETKIALGSRTGMLEIQQKVPDVVFLDINMPGLDGFDVLAYLRRLPQMKSVPIIIITSDDQPETERRALDTGALSLIVKPVEFDLIEKVLRDAGVLIG